MNPGMSGTPARRSWSLAALLAALVMLGPFSIDMYLPAFPAIGADLAAPPVALQATLSAYLFAYAFMMLWHGALSDALGRRPVVLAGLVVYAIATLGCAVAGNIESMWLARALQGLSAGAGVVVGRALIRDRFHGAEAQKLMSQVTLVFSIAPAVAPIAGGLLLEAFGWRSIFHALFAFTVLLGVWTARAEHDAGRARAELQLDAIAAEHGPDERISGVAAHHARIDEPRGEKGAPAWSPPLTPPERVVRALARPTPRGRFAIPPRGGTRTRSPR